MQDAGLGIKKIGDDKILDYGLCIKMKNRVKDYEIGIRMQDPRCRIRD